MKKLREALRKSRGSALILAILVILVLTVVGVGVAYFTQVEDQTSGNVRLSKAAFYGAETGLRVGEQIINTAAASSINMDSLLTVVGTPVPLPDGGYPGRLLSSGGTPQYQVIVPGSGPGRADRAIYSLYVRNNAEDAGGELDDRDNKINLISIGGSATLTNGGTVETVLTTKILEEQINALPTGDEAGTQKGRDPSGTGSGIRGPRRAPTPVPTP
jgi:hypothetical protein